MKRILITIFFSLFMFITGLIQTQSLSLNNIKAYVYGALVGLIIACYAAYAAIDWLSE